MDIIETRQEIYIFDKSQKLNLGKPAAILFENISPIAATQIVINDSLVLDSFGAVISGVAFHPYEYKPLMQSNEVDITPYNVRFTGAGLLRVTVKYYVK